MHSENDLILQSGNVSLSVCAFTGKVLDLSLKSESGKTCALLLSRPVDSMTCVQPSLKDIFDIRCAWGLDECFPSVGSFPEFGIRDHGWIWTSPSIVRTGCQGIHCDWILENNGAFSRSIAALPIAQNQLAVYEFSLDFPAYFLGNQSSLWCESIYASHALFAVEAGDKLEIWDTLDNGNSPQLCWEGVFPDSSSNVARKFFVKGTGRLCARLNRRAIGVQIQVSCESRLPFMGIWWCNNGWGDGRPHATVGIEPTNALSDGPVFCGAPRDQDRKARKSARYIIEISKLPQ